MNAMNKYKMIAPAFWLFAILACQNHKDTKETIDDGKTVKVIKIDEAKSWEVNDFFRLSKAVPLSDSILISNVNKLIFHNDKILILDKSLKSIIRFSEAGDFEMIINDVGKGPKEYTSLSNFLVEQETNDILILGGDNWNEILRFSWDGKFKERYPLSFSAVDFEIIEDGFLFYCGNILNKDALTENKSFFNILVCDKDFNITNRQLPIPNFWDGLSYGFRDTNRFSKYGQDIYCQMSIPNNTTIYKLQDSTIAPHYFFDFGKDLRTILTSYNNVGDIIDKVKKEEFPCRLDCYFENDRLVHFVVVQGKRVHQIIYDKKKRKVFSRHIKLDDVSNHFLPINYHGNGEFMVHVLTPFLISEGKLEFELPADLKDQVTPNSNPVLLFFDIK